ncbi:hypothetical protein Tco_0994551 [Tanacetum coccineum]
MISMNITSPSSSLEQTNFILEDWGTNQSDSSIEFSFRTCYVAMEANRSGYGCGLELVFPRLPSSSCRSSGLLTWDPSGCLGWIVMVSPRLFCSGLKVYHLPPASSVVSEQDELPSSVGLDFRALLGGDWIYSEHLKAKRLH